MRLVGLILAGGRSSRMGGGDKTLLPLAGRPVIDHVLRRLRPQVTQVALNANGDAGRFAALGLPVLADEVPGFAGPLAGILAGLRWAGEVPADAMVSAAGDTPFLPADLAARLAEASDGANRIVVARTAGRLHPVFGLWPLAMRDELADFVSAGGRRVTGFLEGSGFEVVDFDLAASPAGTYDPFFNINTPGDHAEAEAIAEQMP